jgi:ABC-2 type transport system permease protein
MGILLHILHYKIVSFFKSTFEWKLSTILRGVGSLLVFGGFALGAYYLSREITEYVLTRTRTGLFLFHRFVGMLLFVFFAAVNLGNIIVSYATLYKSAEVGYLLTKPVSFINIFVLKFLDNFLYSSTTLFLIAFMVLLGYGSFFSYSWLTILGLLVFLLVPFMFLAACFAIMILMALLRIASRWGFRRVMTGLGILYVGLIYIFFRYTNPIKLVEEVNKHYPNVDEYFMTLDVGLVKYLPHHWVSEFMLWLSRGELVHGLPFLGILVGVTAAAFVVCLLIAHRFYYRGWLITFDMQAASNSARRFLFPQWFDFRNPSRFSPQLEVLLKKDFFQFIREPSQWIHLGVLLVLIAVFVLSLSGLRFAIRFAELQLATYLVLFAFSAFLSSSLALRFVFPMISLEGKSFWTILSSPVPVKQVFSFKFLMGLALVAVPAAFVATFMNLPFRRLTPDAVHLLWFGLHASMWISVAMVSLNLGFGGYFANFQEKNPIRLASSQGATLTFLLSLLYLVGLVLIVVLPLSHFFEAAFFRVPYDSRGLFIASGILALFSAVATVTVMTIGRRALERDF